MRTWKPKEKEVYWSIGFNGEGSLDVHNDLYEPEEHNFNRVDINDNNYFKTKILAQAALKRIKKILKGVKHG